MKAHIEIAISLKRPPRGGLHRVLREFCDAKPDWDFPQRESRDYRSHHGLDAGFVMTRDVNGLSAAAIAIANCDEKHPKSFRVPNIVPRECSCLNVDEYNAVGLAFVRDFREWLGSRGAVRTIGPERTLEDIIPGEKARHLFEAWLRTPTPLSHPADIDVLNRFICHHFRHPGKTRTYEIEPYLLHDRGWSPQDARSVAVRIATGLELLSADRRFR